MVSSYYDSYLYRKYALISSFKVIYIYIYWGFSVWGSNIFSRSTYNLYYNSYVMSTIFKLFMFIFAIMFVIIAFIFNSIYGLFYRLKEKLRSKQL